MAQLGWHGGNRWGVCVNRPRYLLGICVFVGLHETLGVLSYISVSALQLLERYTKLDAKPCGVAPLIEDLPLLTPPLIMIHTP